MITTASVFVVYTLGIFSVAAFAYTKTRNRADFLLANRELRAWSAALSAGASDMSGWLLLGLPGLAFVSQFEAAWLALGLMIGTIANWTFIAAPLRRATLNTSGDADAALTLPEYFANRYPELATVLRVSTAILILVFYVFYISAGFVAAAKLFVVVFSLSYTAALAIGGLVVLVYTLVGGFRAVVNTDCIQAIMMITALVGVFFILASAQELPSSFRLAEDWRAGTEVGLVAILSALAWGLGYPGQPHILTRFMAMRGKANAKSGARIATIWTTTCLVCAVGIGWTATNHPILGEFADDPERIFIAAVQLFFHPVMAGALSAAVLAAIMSTADSQLLIAATALFHDLGRTKSSKLNAVSWLFGIRLTITAVAFGGFLLALNPQNSVLALVAYAWAGFGATLGPAVILSLFAAEIRGAAVFFGMVAGAVTVVCCEMKVIYIPGLYSLLPAFLANFIVAASYSRLSKPH